MKRSDLIWPAGKGLYAVDVIARIKSDDDISPARRAAACSAIRQVCRWNDKDPSAVVFSVLGMRKLMAQVSPGRAGISKKSLQNACSLIEFVLRHLGVGRSSRFDVAMSDEYKVWFDQLDRYGRASVGRFFRFLTFIGRPPSEVRDVDAEAFFHALTDELPEERAGNIRDAALRGWNTKLHKIDGWRGAKLSRAVQDRSWALNWDKFPRTLKLEADAMFAARNLKADDLFGDGAEKGALAATTIRNRLEHLRIAASILVLRCGFDPGAVSSLAILCRPTGFKQIMQHVVECRDGKVTPYVEQIAVTLEQAAHECGALSDAEKFEVSQLRRKIYRRRLSDCAEDIHPDQALLDELDEPGRMDALLSLPARTMAELEKRRIDGRAKALVVQRAMALELWLVCPLRITNFSTLRINEHVHDIAVGRNHRTIIRLAAHETKNGKPYECLLHDAAANLLRLYLDEYRPLLADRESAWLFPGRKENHKHAHVLSKQMKQFIWDGAGIRFHPHLIRKIVTKLILDDDPNQIETARILLGHSDTRATRAAYAQAQNRVAQGRYADALEKRRLAALRGYEIGKPQRNPRRSLRVGKGQRVRGGDPK